jgi:hypothetical protein
MGYMMINSHKVLAGKHEGNRPLYKIEFSRDKLQGKGSPYNMLLRPLGWVEV